MPQDSSALDPAFRELMEARHSDPFAVLGRHREGPEEVVRALLPGARQVLLEDSGEELHRIPETDLFELRNPASHLPAHHRLRWIDSEGGEHGLVDPYTFGPRIADFDLHLFAEGRHWHAQRFLGAHVHEADGVEGVLFAVWAPNAERVSVVGDFNQWDGRRHPMRARGDSGVWELFLPGLQPGALYKFEIRSGPTGEVLLKADPYGRRFELRPGTAGIVEPPSEHAWGDEDWMRDRAERDWLQVPLATYEVHLGSWARAADGSFLDYRELAHRLVDYVLQTGFTHVELMPVAEHPLDASWGYQSTGFYAPTSRFGDPDGFRYFVDYCHRHGIGVLLDWVPGHFPKDAHALARFDGTALYEHEDPRRGEHRDWGTLIFNYGRPEVRNFLLSSALFWLEEYHVDGLRVDAVASMLYLDYSRGAEDWVPNIYGGRENLEAIDFLREVNRVLHERHPGALVIAEESTSWPQVTRPPYVGGLGFSMKWNMGWMHDTLEYMALDPIFRHYHHDHLTFGLVYAFTENFVLPFSHDEVVHGKGAMIAKMPGDEWQKFANLRLLYAYMYAYPGKKLLFMGNEFGQWEEWSEEGALSWEVLQYGAHEGLRSLVADLNRLHREEPALHGQDFQEQGFEWIDCHDADQSTLSFLRRDGDRLVVGAFNFTPVPREGFRLGVPRGGPYRELLSSDSAFYGGSDVGNGGGVTAVEEPWMGRPYSLTLTLPPLGAVLLRPADLD
ncbi:glycogen branching protein [Thiohalorhabdus denitrificans]|uniref:1,4-alpha-glucan branching enzyme GlgB n=1 Tax=Thiohalorhabdus denitrificans TaxID=381306 RepID=A0A0P9ENJ9_9GAMM|nr:1,4-alpha-glucan branching protein GlgB [Thiohalorhabdus denitrificans]KPV40072.1 glycogen branching protein [Thiohalorhabdus denitrificans]SCY14585.1 1,4-alpha-glucan branching enzyme [Thiohalorhabdus denitrificans]